MTSYSVSILCGGESRRMKEDKAMMDWNGMPLARYLAGRFPSCDDLFLSVGWKKQFSIAGIPMVADQVPGAGPLAGLAASLRAARHPALFVTTCDAPLVSEALADWMAERLEDFDAVVPVDENRVHPLIAMYQTSVVCKAEEALHKGTRKLQVFLQELHVRYVDARELPLGSSVLANLNTQQEVQLFLAAHPTNRNFP